MVSLEGDRARRHQVPERGKRAGLGQVAAGLWTGCLIRLGTREQAQARRGR
jgi:hypothetical protein